MILADSSVWIDHIRAPVPLLVRLLEDEEVVIHPFVIGEIALGSVKKRSVLISKLTDLPSAKTAEHDEVMIVIERYRLFGLGIGYVDAHLLAAVLLTPETRLWTRDKRLHAAAERLDLAAADIS